LAIEQEGQEALHQRSSRPLRLKAAMALALLLIAGVTVWTYRRSSHLSQSVAQQRVPAASNPLASLSRKDSAPLVAQKVSPQRQQRLVTNGTVGRAENPARTPDSASARH